jgi:hypothetical protein
MGLPRHSGRVGWISHVAELPVDFSYTMDQEVPDCMSVIVGHAGNQTGFKII